MVRRQGPRLLLPTTLVETSRNPIAPDPLPTDWLIKNCSTPGYLEYEEYVRYLKELGHLHENMRQSQTSAPRPPQNSSLQTFTGDRTDDLTDFRADQALWSIENLPNILYIFEKPVSWHEAARFEAPPTKQYQIYGKFLKDIPILPDHISSRLEGWRLEAWMRFDPRISLRDIYDRIDPKNCPLNTSTIQMRMKRFRADCNILGWVTPGGRFQENKNKILAGLVRVGVDTSRNTTRGLSWGLIDPSRGEAGGRVSTPSNTRVQNTVDMTTFAIQQRPKSGHSWQSNGNSNTHISEEGPGIVARSIVPSQQPPFLDHWRLASPASLLISRCGLLDGNGPYSNDDTSSDDEQTSMSYPRTSSSGSPTSQSTNITSRDMTRHSESLSLSEGTPEIPSMGIPVFTFGQLVVWSSGATTVRWCGHILTLKSARERSRPSRADIVLLSTFYPAHSPERLRQLEFTLDIDKLKQSDGVFLDNHGYFEMIGSDATCNSTDLDIVYDIDYDYDLGARFKKPGHSASESVDENVLDK